MKTLSLALILLLAAPAHADDVATPTAQATPAPKKVAKKKKPVTTDSKVARTLPAYKVTKIKVDFDSPEQASTHTTTVVGRTPLPLSEAQRDETAAQTTRVHSAANVTPATHAEIPNAAPVPHMSSTPAPVPEARVARTLPSKFRVLRSHSDNAETGAAPTHAPTVVAASPTVIAATALVEPPKEQATVATKSVDVDFKVSPMEEVLGKAEPVRVESPQATPTPVQMPRPTPMAIPQPSPALQPTATPEPIQQTTPLPAAPVAQAPPLVKAMPIAQPTPLAPAPSGPEGHLFAANGFEQAEQYRMMLRFAYLAASYNQIEGDLENGATTYSVGVAHNFGSIEARVSLEVGYGLDQAIVAQNTRQVLLRADANYLFLDNWVTPIAGVGVGYGYYNVFSVRSDTNNTLTLRENDQTSGLVLIPQVGVRFKLRTNWTVDLSEEYQGVLGAADAGAIGGLATALTLGIPF